MAKRSTGFDKNFLGKALPFPRLDKGKLAPLLKGAGNEIKYTHFSVFVNKDRRLPLMSAVNIKGEAYASVVREGSEPWDYSDQIEKKYQLDNTFYGKDDNTFDRGHLVRRVDPCWGATGIAAKAENETFRWVNCTPQHKKLNQKGGVWYQLEQHVLEHGVKGKLANICVFAGPVLQTNDKVFVKKYKGTEVPIPIVFWKVIVWRKSDSKLYAVGFLMNQLEWIKSKLVDKGTTTMALEAKPPLPDDYFEKLKFNDNKTYQVRIADIEKATGIKFDWANVNFPFKSATPTAIRARKLTKVYSFETIYKTKERISAVTGVAATASAITTELSQITPLSEKEIKYNVALGYGGLIKQYNISNIKL